MTRLESIGICSDCGEALLECKCPTSSCMVDSVSLSLDFVQRVEAAHFRTDEDSGACEQAMMLWNMVRRELGLPRLEKRDLPSWDGRKYAMPADSNLFMNQQAQALGRLAKGKRKTTTPASIAACKRNLARANEALKKKRGKQ